jgi:hypothetical protein
MALIIQADPDGPMEGKTITSYRRKDTVVVPHELQRAEEEVREKHLKTLESAKITPAMIRRFLERDTAIRESEVGQRIENARMARERIKA